MTNRPIEQMTTLIGACGTKLKRFVSRGFLQTVALIGLDRLIRNAYQHNQQQLLAESATLVPVEPGFGGR